MSERALLIPNLGAEEGAGWDAPAFDEIQASEPPEQHARKTAARTAAQLWCALFAADSRCLGEAANAPDRFWPPELGPRSAAAIFDWLDEPDAAIAWLNTPAAAHFARREDRRLLGAPPEVVRAVHDKAFCHRVALEENLLPAGLDEMIAVLEPELLRDTDAAVAAIEARLASWPAWTGGRFALKPRFGTSGRGRVAGEAGRVADGRDAFARLADSGGALLEPWLTRTCDLSAQLRVDSDGQIVLLGTTELLVAGSGLYRGHRGLVDGRGRVTSGSRYDEALREAAVAVAQHAAVAGYRGPCGVDAFAFEAEAGRTELRAAVEFNARFTLGTVAIGLLRRALPGLGPERFPRPGELRAFQFQLDAPPGGWPDLSDANDVLSIALGDPDAGAEPALLIADDRTVLDRHLAIRRASHPACRMH
jgi:hypothetical protein